MGHSPAVLLGAAARATTLVADGLSEEQLMPLLARCAADATGADLSAIYLQPEHPSPKMFSWRLGGHWGGDPELLATLPTSFGQGGAVLAPLFQSAIELSEPDLLDGAAADAAVPHQLPARSLAGVPLRRRDRRLIGVLLVASLHQHAFDAAAIDALRSIAQLTGIGIDNARLAAGQQRDHRMVAESSVTLGTVLESVGIGVCVVELDGTVRMANKALQQLFGLSPRVDGTPETELFATATTQPSAADAFQARFHELVAQPSQIDESEWELATDPPRIVQRYSAPMRSVLGEVVGRVEVYTEVTESRRLYTQLLNSEKLRAIGEMASGVAHDFNNLLASILGQTELLHADDLPPATRQAIATVRQAALDGARMVRNLQGLARPRVETPSSSAELTETIQLAVDMARPRWMGAALHGHGKIDLHLDLTHSQTLSRVAIDPAELREVLLNLMFNAFDAMPQGGRIDIATRNGFAPGMAEVEVRDTGEGMPESVRARIFEPFFSTKGPKGSGLGLAVAYSVITRHGGHIDVRSAVGQGTTFTMSLPYAPQATPATAAPAVVRRPERALSAPAAAALALTGARILVADDEPGLVAIVRQLMERSGAIVSIACGGRAALAALDAAESNFDVVITDLDMPDVDGWAVAAAVKNQTPGTHVVMLTGWAGEIAPEDSKARGVDAILAKPCSRAELELVVGGLLAPEPPGGLELLLVDNEPGFARALRDLLALQGHRVTVVNSAAAALDSVAAHTFDVVLADYSLGQISGAELAERLADQSATPYVVLVTGYATQIDDPTLLTRGVHAVLPKPCRAEDIRGVLARFVPVPTQ